MAKKRAAKAASAKKKGSTKRTASTKAKGDRRCGLCGATTNLVKTECCGNWICNDEENYVMFSFARNSCSRNHRRYTLCGYHFNEEHGGKWQDCAECRNSFETEMYVYYGTNEYNFEVLENPPEYEPTKCAECGAIIVLGDGGYMTSKDGYLCPKCTAKRLSKGL
jgi:DNA-directed RNA polymerase subunit RPC12/RpoP